MEKTRYGELQKLIDMNILQVRHDGLLKRTGHPSDGLCWQHVVRTNNKDCTIWHLILAYVQIFVPSECQECWKVVVRPKTLRELFELLQIQEELQLPSKCGIERRETVSGLYGGYFYNDSLDEGLECYRTVCDAITMPAILKRGCTEFELACGDSREWTVTDSQKEMEGLVERYVVKYTEDFEEQPERIVEAIHRKWIEWAYQNGDVTYKEYTDGKPMYVQPVTYHNS